jgi:hypothetical protein
MRFLIIAAALVSALTVSGVSAQVSKVTGTQAFCAVNDASANCSFDTAAACEKGIANMGTGSQGYSCSERQKLNVKQ